MANAKPAKKIVPLKTVRTRNVASENARARNGRAFVLEHREDWHDHFDLRLECDGVLKSWAVPNGPPAGEAMQPRLAVRMDDAPVCESKQDAIWDRGTWEPTSDPVQGFADGKLAFELRGERVKGDFSLLRLRSDTGRKQGKENWLLKMESPAKGAA